MNTIPAYDRKVKNSLIITQKGTGLAETHFPSMPEKQRRKLGTMKDSVKIIGDIVSPASDENEWEALQE